MDDNLKEWTDIQALDSEDQSSPLDEIDNFNNADIQIRKSSIKNENLTDSEVMRREEDLFTQRKLRNEDKR